MEALPVEKFFGVGKVTAAKMKGLGLAMGGDLKALTEAELVKHFGKVGRFYFGVVRGIDNRPVEPARETKSIGAEDTFEEDLTSLAQMNEELIRIAVLVEDRMKRHALKGRTVTVKIKYHDFRLITCSRSFLMPINDLNTIAVTAKNLLAETNLEEVKIRLLGITLSNFGEGSTSSKEDRMGQLQLFS